MKLKTTLYRSVEAGAFRFNFYRDEKKLRKGRVDGTYLKISAIGKGEQWTLTIPGNSHVYGYLLAALEQGKNDQLHGYAFMLNVVSMLLTQDEGFNADIQKAITDWYERINKVAEDNAKAVSDAEETASQAFMEDVVAYAEASPKERKRMSEESRKEMREILKEDRDGE